MRECVALFTLTEAVNIALCAFMNYSQKGKFNEINYQSW